MLQTPLLWCPLKQTHEIDWVQPLKSYIGQTYGDDPQKYTEECATLNRLRQDMRGAGKDSIAGRDLLYRYYGQLELLDLRFPVDESHIQVSFTWIDAFTDQSTSQYSLAYEKASIIFNISAALSCHAAGQDRSLDSGQKAAYHSFQASAGMFTYINDNFLHAPSKDLSRETVKCLIIIMLAQAQEVFVEKQIADQRKSGLLAKLSGQASLFYTQAVEGIQENVAKEIFDRSWQLLTQIKAIHLSSVSQYFQALADDDANSHGAAIARLQVAEREAREACRLSSTFPVNLPSKTNLTNDARQSLIELTTRHAANVQQKLLILEKDNDFIYHQCIPIEASLGHIPKLIAAKAISVNELYQGQDIQRIIGPDIFQKIIPIAVTEAASLYDEEKAKLIRGEAEKVEVADDELVTGLDYLKLPGSLTVLKGGMDHDNDVDTDFKSWCDDLAGHEPFKKRFEDVRSGKAEILESLSNSSRKLDQEETTCEKMRAKYGAEWTQPPSSRLTSVLRSEISGYKDVVHEASTSDTMLSQTYHQHETDFDEMRSAGETQEADVLYSQAIMKAGASRARSKVSHGTDALTETSLLDEDYGEGGTSVMEEIVKIEDIIKKLHLVRRDRAQVLKDLKDKIHNDDISSVLILNKKSISQSEGQLFQAELEKFRPHQNRITQANHKQMALLKDLTRTYGALLRDRRVKAEQEKYATQINLRVAVLGRYRRIFQAYNNLTDGLCRAQKFYSEMKSSVDSTQKNVETFVSNRRVEGAQMLNQIEIRDHSGYRSPAGTGRDFLNDGMHHNSSEPVQPHIMAKQEPMSSAASGHYDTHLWEQQSVRQSTRSRNDAVSNRVDHVREEPFLASGAFVQRSTSGADGNPGTNSYSPQRIGVQTTTPHTLPSPFNSLSHQTFQDLQRNLPHDYIPPPPPPGPPPGIQETYRVSDSGGAVGRGPSRDLASPQLQATPAPSLSADPWAGLKGWNP